MEIVTLEKRMPADMRDPVNRASCRGFFAHMILCIAGEGENKGASIETGNNGGKAGQGSIKSGAQKLQSIPSGKIAKRNDGQRRRTMESCRFVWATEKGSIRGRRACD